MYEALLKLRLTYACLVSGRMMVRKTTAMVREKMLKLMLREIAGKVR